VRKTLAALAVVLCAAPTASASPIITLTGRGWGHGVGMAQDGAEGMAQMGSTTPEILSHFYPGTTIEARRMLEKLAGRTHQVLTGIAAVTRKGVVSEVEITQVFFDLINEEELLRYLESGEPLDKAGAYGIQGYAARWIPRIEGCFFNVVGFPLSRTLQLLARARAGQNEAAS